MKILVISDTHKYLKNANTIIDKLKDRVDVVAHLGDNIEDARILDKKYDIDFKYVSGNCDYEGSNDCILDYNDKRIFMTHGHRYNVKWGLENLYYKALEEKANIVLFGHTHVPLIEYMEGILFLNPGSLSLPRGQYDCSYGVIDIDESGKIEPAVMELKDNGNIKSIFF